MSGTPFRNQVFDRLGADGDDIEALTAYALYKRHKRKWASEYEAANGSLPDAAAGMAFAAVATTDDQLERYKKDARDILIAFANQTVEEVRPQIAEEAITSRIEQAAEKVAGQGSFVKQVLVGLVATAINTAILLLLAVGIRLFGIDLIDAIQAFSPASQVSQHHE